MEGGVAAAASKEREKAAPARSALWWPGRACPCPYLHVLFLTFLRTCAYRNSLRGGRRLTSGRWRRPFASWLPDPSAMLNDCRRCGGAATLSAARLRSRPRGLCLHERGSVPDCGGAGPLPACPARKARECRSHHGRPGAVGSLQRLGPLAPLHPSAPIGSRPGWVGPSGRQVLRTDSLPIGSKQMEKRPLFRSAAPCRQRGAAA